MERNKYDNKKDWRVLKSIGAVDPTIIKFIEEIFELYEVRRKVGKVDGISFEVRSKEKNHSIPHVHAKYAEYEISIAIDDGRVLEGNLPRRQEYKAINWVQKNKDKLIRDWSNYAVSATSLTTKSRLDDCYNVD